MDAPLCKLCKARHYGLCGERVDRLTGLRLPKPRQAPRPQEGTREHSMMAGYGESVGLPPGSMCPTCNRRTPMTAAQRKAKSLGNSA